MCLICDPTRRDFLRLGLGAAGLAALSRPARAAMQKPLIMLDPGHGGHDPGAIAPDGYYEKTITLATALEFHHALLETGRYRVAMTRSSDEFITLEGRVNLALEHKADLFLSMHCDHLPESDLRGASVFTLSNKASDRLAAAVAADENSADGPSAGPSGVSPQVANILASLETRATKIGSATFQNDIASSLAGDIPLLPDPKRSANFAVLRDPSIPSVLLEMGCLSNAEDERRLRDLRQRRQLVAKLTRAVDHYFTGPAGGRMAG
ncbi:N-acetylmuramoyl-L-alanine amidase family protein [Acidocella facilis]|uniref:N-acetylmuramoyl-L-alanine amidase family protein n=1 Tax=Acidocella facilis TaxID=525 RepID=UPI001F1CCB86|nr:N-acetylmuramoyl-L-alanine amidase [Acidocella facilis]